MRGAQCKKVIKEVLKKCMKNVQNFDHISNSTIHKKESLFLNTLFYSIALLGNSWRIQRDTAYKNRIDEQWKKVVNRHTSIMFT